MNDLLAADEFGIECALGGFWIDPWRPVPVAVITHAHGDHARFGSAVYHAAEGSRALLDIRLRNQRVVYHAYREAFALGDAVVSFHPAGHVRGSAQVRVEPRGGGPVWVASGDYKRAPDPTCEPFEVVRCDGFITEATFALPAYRWEPTAAICNEMLDWWMENRKAGRASVLFSYALGKAQRVLAELRAQVALRFGETEAAEGSERFMVYTHGAVEPLVEAYRREGVRMLPTRRVSEAGGAGTARGAGSGKRERGVNLFAGALVIAPPSAAGSVWMRRFGADAQTAFASGWMRIRGVRRRRGYDRGFVLSDHADWPDLLRTIDETGARTVLMTHGSSETLARFVRETRGVDARPLETRYTGEEEIAPEEVVEGAGDGDAGGEASDAAATGRRP